MTGESRTVEHYARFHLRFGWWSLLVFATFGLVLESLHGFKVPAYLDVSNSARRLMWTLAHAHGTLLSIIHVVLGVTLRTLTEQRSHNLGLVSWSLVGASVLLPGGFFLGGIVMYGGDPGVGVALVPVGAVLLLIAIFLVARTVGSATPPKDARGADASRGQHRTASRSGVRS